MRLLTRGLGGGQGSGLILSGMTAEAVRIIRGGRSALKKAYNDLLSEFNIAVKLLEINGKEILAPIINRRKYVIDESIEHSVSVRNVKVQNIEVNKTNVFAKLLRINRGSDGKN